jgi:hypothetical protein
MCTFRKNWRGRRHLFCDIGSVPVICEILATFEAKGDYLEQRIHERGKCLYAPLLVQNMCQAINKSKPSDKKGERSPS